MFLKDQELYKHEVSLEAILLVLKPIILSGMVCLSIFGGSIHVMTYVYLVILIHAYRLYDFMFFEQISFNIDVFTLSYFLVFRKINVRFLKTFWKQDDGFNVFLHADRCCNSKC